MKQAVKKTRPHPRWKCRNCGNSALFVEERRSISQRIIGWGGREHGYTGLSEFTTQRLEAERRYAKPAYCWVCGSQDISYAQLTKEETHEPYRYDATETAHHQEPDRPAGRWLRQAGDARRAAAEPGRDDAEG